MSPATITAAIAALNAEYLQNVASLAALPTQYVASEKGRSLNDIQATRAGLSARNKEILEQLQQLSPVDFVVAGTAGY